MTESRIAESISRRTFLGGLGAAAPARSTSELLGEEPTARSLNIVIFMPDQLPAHELGAFGGQNIPTPNMDRVVAEGLSFTNALSTSPLCTPYRGMPLSGRDSPHNAVVHNWLGL